MDSHLIPWDDEFSSSPWHPRRYRRHHPINIFDETKRMEKEMDRMTKDMRNMMSSMERRMSRSMDLTLDDERPFDFPAMSSLEHHIEGDEKSPGKYTMSIPLGKYISPQDLKVSCKDNVMTVEARKDRHSGDGTRRVHQEYMRKFTLPQSVNMNEVKSNLTPDGYLEIEAPLPTPPAITEAPKIQEIPVLHL